MTELETDVAVIGCGPVGALVANLLGLHGVRAVVLERDHAPHEMSRAISCDDESFRIFQRVGLDAALLAEMRPGENLRFTNGADETFAEIEVEGLDLGLGHAVLQYYHQPYLERTLRDGFQRRGVALRLGAEVEALEQDASGVTLTAREGASGETLRVRARYALGCDGARSPTRERLGIALQGTRSEPWLGITVRLPPGLPPPRSRVVCDPRRPHFVAVLPDGYLRFEVLLMPGDTVKDMERSDTVRAIIARHIDPDRVTLVRAAVYTFLDASASPWSRGRVFLLGDAAHTMPPFMGQGLCSGFRDAANLSWKLALVLRGAASPSILHTYERERRPHVEETARASTALGHIFMARDARLAGVRDRVLQALDRVGPVRRFIRGFGWKPLPAFERGLVAGGHRRSRRTAEGTMIIQPEVVNAMGATVPLDEVLGKGFAVLAWDTDPLAAAPEPLRAFWDRLGATFVRALPPACRTFSEDPRVTDVYDGTGKLEAWFKRAGARLVLLRPDGFVFAAVDARGAGAAADELRAALGAGG